MNTSPTVARTNIGIVMVVAVAIILPIPVVVSVATGVAIACLMCWPALYHQPSATVQRYVKVFTTLYPDVAIMQHLVSHAVSAYGLPQYAQVMVSCREVPGGN